MSTLFDHADPELLASIYHAVKHGDVEAEVKEEPMSTPERVWAAHKPRRVSNLVYKGKGYLYRVTHTLFVDHAPAERTNIEFFAMKPGVALAVIEQSGKCPAEFHGHAFN